MKESSFQFSDPRLMSLDFDVNNDFEKDTYEGFSLNNEVSKLLISEGKEALVILTLSIGDQSNKSPFYIKLKMSAKFKCGDSCMFDKLIDTNAPAMLLSYARPIVSLITSQSGYSAFNIPFINFVNE